MNGGLGSQVEQFWGGKAIYVTYNSKIVIGAGGGGGGGQWELANKHTQYIANQYFSSGGGGGSNSAAGTVGTTINGCIPASAGASTNGAAGANFLGDGILLEQPNGSIDVSFKVSRYNLQESVFDTFTLNSILNIQDEFKNMRCKETGKYFLSIRVSNGYVWSGFVDIKYDDILSYRICSTNSAVLMINDIVIASIRPSDSTNVITPDLLNFENITQIDPNYITNSVYGKDSMSGTASLQIGSVETMLPSEIGVSVNTTVRRLYKTTSDSLYNVVVKARNGDTMKADLALKANDTVRVAQVGDGVALLLNDEIPLLVAASPGGKDPDTYGNPIRTDDRSYANNGLLTRIEYTPTATQELLVTITAKSEWDDTTVGDLGKGVNDILIDLDEIKSLLNNIGSSIPIITVIRGKPFEYYVPAYDDMDSGNSIEGLVITNDNKSDGLIRLSGTLTMSVGVKVLEINNRSFVVNVVQEPDSTSVLPLILN